jgi:hypothetical protein
MAPRPLDPHIGGGIGIAKPFADRPTPAEGRNPLMGPDFADIFIGLYSDR